MHFMFSNLTRFFCFVTHFKSFREKKFDQNPSLADIIILWHKYSLLTTKKHLQLVAGELLIYDINCKFVKQSLPYIETASILSMVNISG